jgi:SAM-dependent methyltransferase
MTRDTDFHWNVIAARYPFFGVLTNERYLPQNLTREAIEEFYSSGPPDVEHAVAMLRRVGDGQFAPDSALDFGCGVGRVTFPMTAYAKRVYGVDVADEMLSIARQQARSRGVGDIQWSTTLPPARVDWVNSVIALQHIPPERGFVILGQLVDLLAPGGFLSVQVSFFRDARQKGDLVRDVQEFRYDGRTVELLSEKEADPGSMWVYDYDMNRVLRILYLGGIDSVVAEHTDHGGCHGAWLFGQRSR